MGGTIIKATNNECRTLRGIVYLIINKINNKVYIGKTTNTFFKRYGIKWWENKSIKDHFRAAIEKYGYENFQINILRYNKSDSEIDIWETFFIKYFKSDNPEFGYNIKEGGQGGKLNYSNRIKRCKMKRPEIEGVIEEAQLIHGDKYSYSYIIRHNGQRLGSTLEIECKKCGNKFVQSKTEHIKYHKGCGKCFKNKMSEYYRKPIEKFLQESIGQHGENYEYDFSNYKSGRSKIKITHKICGFTFLQSAEKHCKRGQGCPKCFGKPEPKPVAKLDSKTGDIIEAFKSISEAGRSLGKKMLFGYIRNACNNEKEFMGFKWKFL